MLNVRKVIVDAYKMIGDIGDNEALDGTRTVTGETLLNEMVTQLNLDNYFAFTMQNLEFTPTSTEMSFTIGIPDVSFPDVDINATRPSNITRLYAKYNASDTTAYEITQVGLHDLPMFTVESSSLPSHFAYKSSYPHGEIHFSNDWSGNYSMIVSYNVAIPTLDINDQINTIPPEYEPALKYGLAVLLAKRYGKPREVIVDMTSLRDDAYKKIKDNTQRKLPFIAHMGAKSGFDNVLNRGGIY